MIKKNKIKNKFIDLKYYIYIKEGIKMIKINLENLEYGKNKLNKIK